MIFSLTATGGIYNGNAYGAEYDTETAELMKLTVLEVRYVSESGSAYNALTAPVAAGKYRAMATVQAGSATAVLNYVFEIEKISVTPPAQEDLIYNGSSLVPTIPSSPLYTIVSNSGGTNAGTHEIVLTLVDPVNYKWSTTDQAEIRITYEIQKQTVTAPVLQDLVYNGTLLGLW